MVRCEALPIVEAVCYVVRTGDPCVADNALAGAVKFDGLLGLESGPHLRLLRLSSLHRTRYVRKSRVPLGCRVCTA